MTTLAPDPGELRDALREGLAAARELWAHLDAAPRPGAADVAAAQEAVLATLPVDARLVALALAGPTWPATEAEAEDAAAFRDLLEADPGQAAAIAEGRLVGLSESLDLEQLWNLLRHQATSRPVRGALAALALGLRRVFPFSMTDPDDVLLVAPGRTRDVLVLGLGLAAAEEHRTAEMLVRRLGAAVRDDPGLMPAVVRGLGRGLLADGLAWIEARAVHALDDRDEWLVVAERALEIALRTGGGAPGGADALATAEGLLAACLAAADDAEAADRLLDRAQEADAGDLFARLLARWTAWPAPARAALLRRAASIGRAADLPWLADASAEVLLTGLTMLPDPALGRDGQALRPLLLHPSLAVRQQVVVHLLQTRTLHVAPHPPGDRAQARVVSLPHAAFARTTLDRLRVALVDDQPESVPALLADLAPAEQPAAREALLASLHVADVAVRRVAIEGLALVGRPEDTDAILEAARRYRGLEGLAVATLRALGARDRVQEVADLFARRLRWADDDAVDDFVALAGEGAAGFLIEALKTRFYPPARAGAARALGRHDLRSGLFALRTRSLTDPNADVRSDAVDAVTHLSGSAPSSDEVAGYALLVAPMDDLEAVIERARAAGSAALPGIRMTLSQGSWRRRTAACEVLEAVPSSDAEDVLVETLLDPDEDVRMAARKALHARGWRPLEPRTETLDAMAERRFDRLLDAPDAVHVEVLEDALHLGGHVFRTEVLACLRGLERDRRWHPSPRSAAALLITELDAPAALQEADGLVCLLRGLDRTWQLHPHRALLARALRRVPPAELEAALGLEDWGWRAREAVCHALGRPGDDGAVPTLGRFVLDPDEDVRVAAVEALVRVGTTGAARALCEGAESPFQEDADLVARGLAAIGAPAVPALAGLAASPWWESRRVAAMALEAWRLDRQEAADLALPLALDGEYRVAEAARTALETHGLRPRPAAVRAALGGARTLTVEGAERWLGADPRGGLRDPSARAAVARVVRAAPPDDATSRVGLAGALRVRELEGWLEGAARGEAGDHIGLRVAASQALRLLTDRTCRSCEGRGVVRCVGCDGSGERPCPLCDGSGTLEHACPDPHCTARQTTRAIGSRACETCRGRGRIVESCACADGRVACGLCQGTGRTPCLVCDGRGEIPPAADAPPPEG